MSIAIPSRLDWWRAPLWLPTKRRVEKAAPLAMAFPRFPSGLDRSGNSCADGRCGCTSPPVAPLYVCLQTYYAAECTVLNGVPITCNWSSAGSRWEGTATSGTTTVSARVTGDPTILGYTVYWSCDNWAHSQSLYMGAPPAGSPWTIQKTNIADSSGCCTAGDYLRVSLSDASLSCPPVSNLTCTGCTGNIWPNPMFCDVSGHSCCGVSFDGTYSVPQVSSSASCKWVYNIPSANSDPAKCSFNGGTCPISGQIVLEVLQFGPAQWQATLSTGAGLCNTFPNQGTACGVSVTDAAPGGSTLDCTTPGSFSQNGITLHFYP